MPKKNELSSEELLRENQKLEAQVSELQETFRAIKQDEVDALIINTPQGDRVFTLKGADQTYRSLIEQMKEGAALLSEDSSVLYSNSSLAKMLKMPLQKIICSKIGDFVAPTHKEAFDDLIVEAKKCRKTSGEIILQRDDGTAVPTIMSLTCMNADGVKGTYAVITDISEHMEKEVKSYTKRLEAEVKEKTEALGNAERMVAIGETAGMVGHDIRNPLQTIMGELFLARDTVKQLQDGPVKRELNETLNTIEDQASYMNKIVSDLQDFARPLKPDQKPTSIKALCSEILRDIKVPEGVTVSTEIEDGLPDFVIDPSLTRRVLVNLLYNAIQAIPKEGKITIAAEQDDGSLHISVRDNGAGIPDELRPKIFKPLFTTKAKGQGFGLAVVKRIVESQNGEVTFESQRGKGTTFRIELPAKQPSTAMTP